MLKAVLLLLVNCCAIQLLPAQVRFSMPLKGVVGADFYINHYVDHKTDSALGDVYCGTKTYNGHRGTDICISGFAAMDKGVYIYAAANGRVLEAADGEYDRCKKLEKGAKWNYVAIQHDSMLAYYGHMKKGSVMVKAGDSVTEGQPIGMVGSSGYSCRPHLHFEVWNEKGQLVDPFNGGCSERGFSRWKEEPAYDTSLFTINCGFVPYVPEIDQLMEGYLVTDTFYIQQQRTVCFWAQLHGLRKGSSLRSQWYDPRQKLYSTYTWKCKETEWITYAWPYIDMPSIEGKWLAVLYVNDVPVANRYFYVVR